MVADVLVELKAQNIDKTFTYLIPEELKNGLLVGMRVLVPFGGQTLEGFVLSINEKKQDYDYELKSIISLVDEEPILNDELLKLGKYISHKTLSNLINCYQVMLPKALKAKHGYSISKKYDTYVELNKDIKYVPTKKQEEIIALLYNNKMLKKEVANISPGALKTLIDKHIVLEIKEEIYRLNDNIYDEKKDFILTEDQNKVVNEIVSNLNSFTPTLLFGVTGSGKTFVYIKIIEQVLKNDRQVILLVPEISLTPQMVSLFKSHFSSSVAIIHSQLSEGEKYDEWRKIKRGEVSIVIGARSAIFAPFNNLGLIIIDEEHSQTYKQENNPRYSTIDVALWRAKYHQIPIILGSATPSIESFTRAETGIYKLLKLENRINNNLPHVLLVDMKNEIKNNHKILSQILEEKIIDRLNKKEQIILLLNRRGYSTVITCHNCGHVDKCPKCDIPLTYHRTSNTMRCHYCGYGSKKLNICPNCKNEDINQFGMGTEKLEEYLKENFPNAKTIRMDIDTTSRKGAHGRIINAFKKGEYDILIGTQMISKGLDFPNVTLVGVLNGDASLNIPDFRSAERTFQLLNQVAGRAGRGNIFGEVIIQAFNIDHYSILRASKHDYLGFYGEEMAIRRTLKYPPFYNLCLIKIISKDYDLVSKEANKIGVYLKGELKEDIILGPSTASMPKINDLYYFQIIIKYKQTNTIIDAVQFLKQKYLNNRQIMVEIDLNPIRI